MQEFSPKYCSLKKYLTQDVKGYLAYVIDTEVSEQKLEDVPVVREFLDVFPKELPGYHQIERLSSLLIFYLVLAPFPRLLIGWP